ncbi:uncharacterized protein BJ171DRAFT_70752 [Polychytrium aggregatum]|uniref:uncharacterized protein n=1 Tax=Polychytrium aggregatum TaxID=110093 RepID=UPI0022FF2F5C|nr:uncharacterized protein BJ171DRAFT_70752 [Polychytrium aggregatum]KAI9205271.1 hypothetical protein BJ171DRAFT_70752 [Polychytrium aggregatum]
MASARIDARANGGLRNLSRDSKPQRLGFLAESDPFIIGRSGRGRSASRRAVSARRPTTPHLPPPSNLRCPNQTQWSDSPADIVFRDPLGRSRARIRAGIGIQLQRCRRWLGGFLSCIPSADDEQGLIGLWPYDRRPTDQLHSPRSDEPWVTPIVPRMPIRAPIWTADASNADAKSSESLPEPLFRIRSCFSVASWASKRSHGRLLRLLSRLTSEPSSGAFLFCGTISSTDRISLLVARLSAAVDSNELAGRLSSCADLLATPSLAPMPIPNRLVSLSILILYRLKSSPPLSHTRARLPLSALPLWLSVGPLATSWILHTSYCSRRCRRLSDERRRARSR